MTFIIPKNGLRKGLLRAFFQLKLKAFGHFVEMLTRLCKSKRTMAPLASSLTQKDGAPHQVNFFHTRLVVRIVFLGTWDLEHHGNEIRAVHDRLDRRFRTVSISRPR